MSPVGDDFSRQNLLVDLALAQANAAVVASRSQLASFPSYALALLSSSPCCRRGWIWSGSNRIARHG